MKLKQLHIRNIASIESGDIDFESDLRDPYTGLPASLFLISGDTGAGKTVILDCISMALYRRTPRQNSVANKVRNQFHTSEGETIGVGDIEQYTRIGISAKDECYSELLFEGNDGTEYTARLELGMKRRNGAAKGQLQHRPPKWRVRAGNAGWIEGVKEVESVILGAIGITFEQFGRMAMLAQGQFAAFLTGDKKEREQILEQLTSTGHFSKYGDAIKEIYKRRCEEEKLAQTRHDSLAIGRLSAGEREERQLQRKEIAAAIGELDASRKRLEEVRGALAAIAEADGGIEKRSTELAELQTVDADDRHKEMRSLVEGWDATSAPRRNLAELRRQKEVLARHEKEREPLHERYVALYADLGARMKRERELSADMEAEQEWLESRADRKEIMLGAAAIAARMESYASSRETIAKKSGELASLAEAAPRLAEKLAECGKQSKECAEAVEKKRTEIDALNTRLQEFDQKKLASGLAAGEKRRNALAELLTALDRIDSLETERDEAAEALARGEKELEGLAGDTARHLKIVELRREDVEKALRIHDLMEQGVDEAMKRLRRSLAETGAEICPLCGSHIDHLQDAETAIRSALTPAGKVLEEARMNLQDSEKLLKESQRRESEKSGAIAAERRHIGAKEKGLVKQRAAFASAACGLKLPLPIGVDGSAPISPEASAIRSAVDRAALDTEAELTRIREKMARVAALTSELGRLTRELKPLDEAARKADRTLADARKAQETNAESQRRCSSEIGDRRKEMTAIESVMPERLTELYPEWRESTADCMIRLREDAGEYEKHQKRFDESSREGERLLRLTLDLQGFSRDVMQRHPDWDDTPGALMLDAPDIAAEWRSLTAADSALEGEIGKCREEIGRCRVLLDEYYAATGRDEMYISGLIAGEERVAEARGELASLRERITSAADALQELKRKRGEAIALLRLGEGEEMPGAEVVEAAIAENSERRDALNVRKGVIEQELTRADLNEEEYRKGAEALAAATAVRQKWDLINRYFGGSRFRTLVQSCILRPLLGNANIYLSQITDRYRLTCSDDNEQLSILVLDRYNKDQVRSVTVLSGGERFMISLSLSLALSSLNRPDMNVDILFIDEGFGTLDEKSLDSVMSTLERLQEIAGQTGRRVGVISHREELDERIPVRIRVSRHGEGRSRIEID